MRIRQKKIYLLLIPFLILGLEIYSMFMSVPSPQDMKIEKSKIVAQDSIKYSRNDTFSFVDSITQIVEISKRITKSKINQSNQWQKRNRNEFHPENDIRNVIILSYIRSGSSFTGDIIQQHPSTFYVYEPLHYTEHHKDDSGSVSLLNRKRAIIGPGFFLHRAAEILNSYFTCDYSNLDYGTLLHGFMKHGNKTSSFIKCYLERIKVIRETAEPVRWCANKLMGMCRQSNVRVVKTIRLSTSFVEELMDRNKNLKLIHLIRDPRGQIYSIVKAENSTMNIESNSKLKCSHMLGDYQSSLNIERKFPKRFLRLYYEDLALSTLSTSKLIYKFLKLDFSEKIQQYIIGITNSKEDGCVLCTNRKNSSVHAYEWKNGLTFDEVRKIDRHCLKTYEKYGYIPINGENELTDLSFGRNQSFNRVYNVKQ